jgi:flavorubredoxin
LSSECDEEPSLTDPVHTFEAREFLEELDSPADIERLRHLMLNHRKQDHTRSVEILRRVATDATIAGPDET